MSNKLFELAREDLNQKKIYEKYLGRVDGNSTRRIAELVINLLEHGNESYDRSAIRITFRKYVF